MICCVLGGPQPFRRSWPHQWGRRTITIMMSTEESTAPPNDSICSYKRGTCSIQVRKGVRYLQESKTWKDRGGGRGFGWVTRRVVRYRCIMDSMNIETLPSESLPRSSSLWRERFSDSELVLLLFRTFITNISWRGSTDLDKTGFHFCLFLTILGSCL